MPEYSKKSEFAEMYYYVSDNSNSISPKEYNRLWIMIDRAVSCVEVYEKKQMLTETIVEVLDDLVKGCWREIFSNIKK